MCRRETISAARKRLSVPLGKDFKQCSTCCELTVKLEASLGRHSFLFEGAFGCFSLREPMVSSVTGATVSVEDNNCSAFRMFPFSILDLTDEISVHPSGRLPSCAEMPDGSLRTGIVALEKRCMDRYLTKTELNNIIEITNEKS
ncbi:hypothetical protein HELRODRAFT_164912 [Helobdella robusta]|uniref:Uncharacterized protein n=1 Tax=Helobdella robusta TaxID=6412 RepID=T1EVY8_HELRO|nr:hypothetical protein HELRODRAFT_164912 [Helobdella robusta]ESN92795.1 hypothetical protein HELRODRAFT_164912 [Helobdella robusta]